MSAASKGHGFEREILRLLNAARVPGLTAQRFLQGLNAALMGEGFRTGHDAPDLLIRYHDREIHCECKRQERLSLPQWVAQAERDASGTGRIPVILYRRNREQPRIDMALSDWIDLLRPAASEPEEPERDDLPF